MLHGYKKEEGIRVDYEIEVELFARAKALIKRRGLPDNEWRRNGIALMTAWDSLKVETSRNLGTTAIIGPSLSEAVDCAGSSILSKLAECVEVERRYCDGPTSDQTIFLTEESNLNLEIYAFSQGYSSLDPALRDAALFFCNLHELIENIPQQKQ